MPRGFIAVLAAEGPCRAHEVSRFYDLLRKLPDFTVITDEGSFLLAAKGRTATRFDARHGLVLGALFDAHDDKPVSLIAEHEFRAMAASRGQRLIDHYWGGYLAFLRPPDQGSVAIVRSPLGELPCYFIKLADSVVLASNPRLLSQFCGCPLGVDWTGLAQQLLVRELRRRDTCLENVRELRGGERLSVRQGAIVTDTLWSPWAWGTPERAIPSSREAAERLRSKALACIDARAREHGQVLLKLSGGLDSSIVAACMSGAGRSYDSVTLVTQDPSGDERAYARLVASHFKVPLMEAFRQVEHVDVARSLAKDLPRPSVPGFLQESRRIAADAARARGAAVVFDGGGGDNLFCALQSAAPVADCVISAQHPRFIGATATSIARLADSSVTKVLWRGIHRAWNRRRPYRWPVDGRFLSPAAKEYAAGATAHPWLQAPAEILPGKMGHIALLAAAQSYVEGQDPEQMPPLVAPLLAQPLVELCLRIPSWLWFDQGRNRAVARQAFARHLPEPVIARRSKGTPDSFVAQIYETYRARIREMLLDGQLATQGLLDLYGLARAFDDPRPVQGQDFNRIMTLVDAEVWTQGWREGY